MKPWIPGATVIAASRDGGSMTGHSAYAVWHSTENDPHRTTAANIAHYVESVGYQVHIVWNPVTGETVLMLPPDRAGRGLENASGGVQTNRQGRCCIQIEVVGRAAEPFTDGPMVGLAPIVKALRDLGVPDDWPAGSPLPEDRARGANNGSRSVAAWNGPGGHFSHSQVPENHHSDPGAINIARLLGGGTPTPTPAQEDDEMTLKRGDGGRAVGLFQRALIAEARASNRSGGDPLPRFGADSDFGAETEAAVIAYQTGAQVAVTGAIDGVTAALLSRYVTVQS